MSPEPLPEDLTRDRMGEKVWWALTARAHRLERLGEDLAGAAGDARSAGCDAHADLLDALADELSNDIAAWMLNMLDNVNVFTHTDPNVFLDAEDYETKRDLLNETRRNRWRTGDVSEPVPERPRRSGGRGKPGGRPKRR